MAFHIGTVVDQNRNLRYVFPFDFIEKTFISADSYRYGYGFMGKCPIVAINSLSKIEFSFISLTQELNIKFTVSEKMFNVSFDKSLVNESSLRIQINGFEGRAIFSYDSIGYDSYETSLENQLLREDHIFRPFVSQIKALVLSLNSKEAQNASISGGKGSSLASLNQLCETLEDSVNFEVPKGIVVTSNAYQLMIDLNKNIRDSIETMKRVVRFAIISMILFFYKKYNNFQ